MAQATSTCGTSPAASTASATTTWCAAVCLGLGCLWEIDSIFDHVCTLHGIKKRWSVKRLLITLLKVKNPEAGAAVKEALDKDNQDG